MKKMIPLVLLAIILSGCSWLRPHKMDIEQGNIITANEVTQLHAGMSETQVQEIIGSPILVNIFSPTRVEYVYTFQTGYGNMTIKRVSCVFYRGRLQTIQKQV